MEYNVQTAKNLYVVNNQGDFNKIKGLLKSEKIKFYAYQKINGSHINGEFYEPIKKKNRLKTWLKSKKLWR